eukprot:1160730-Pelagomonas_calceolata.AAC.2
MGLHKVCIVLSDTDLPNHTDGWSLSMPLNQTFMSIMSIVTAADAGLILYKGQKTSFRMLLQLTDFLSSGTLDMLKQPSARAERAFNDV